MPIRYRLPCPECSQENLVTNTQAGEIIAGSCGHSIKIPKLQELKRLPIGDEGTVQRSTSWSPWRGFLFAAGVVVASLGFYLHFQIERQRSTLDISQPEFPELEELDIDVQKFPPTLAWKWWKTLRDFNLEYRRSPDYLLNRVKHKELTRYLYISSACIGLGSILVVASIVSGYFTRFRG